MALCVLCNEPITNPICTKCIARSVEVWLMRNNPELIDIVESRLDLFESYENIDNNVKCIICNSTMNVCAYCASQEIYEWIKESNDKITLQTFPFKF